MWFKSTYCANSNCLEAKWKKSTFSETGACVKARVFKGVIEVRDSKLVNSPVVPYSRTEWLTLLASVRAYCSDEGIAEFFRRDGLYYNPEEVTAFRLGVFDGQFDLPRELVYA